jgi:hypothetical protein
MTLELEINPKIVKMFKIFMDKALQKENQFSQPEIDNILHFKDSCITFTDGYRVVRYRFSENELVYLESFFETISEMTSEDLRVNWFDLEASWDEEKRCYLISEDIICNLGDYPDVSKISNPKDFQGCKKGKAMYDGLYMTQFFKAAETLYGSKALKHESGSGIKFEMLQHAEKKPTWLSFSGNDQIGSLRCLIMPYYC